MRRMQGTRWMQHLAAAGQGRFGRLVRSRHVTRTCRRHPRAAAQLLSGCSTSTESATSNEGAPDENEVQGEVSLRDVVPVSATVTFHHRHLGILSSTPRQLWTRNPQNDPGSLYQRYFRLIGGREREDFRVAVSLLDASQPEKQRGSLRKFLVQSDFSSGQLHGVIVYPDGVLLSGLSLGDVARVSAAITLQRPIRQALKAAGLEYAEAPWESDASDAPSAQPRGGNTVVLRQIPGISVLVCAHRARHHRCGECGDTTLEMLDQATRDLESDQSELDNRRGRRGSRRTTGQQQGQQQQQEQQASSDPLTVHVFPSTHLGGSLLGANLVVHPAGDWFGRMHDFFDVQSVLTMYAAAARREVLPLPGSVNHFLAADSERNLRLVRSAQKQGIATSIPAEAVRAMHQQESRYQERGIQTPFESDLEASREKAQAIPEIPADERVFKEEMQAAREKMGGTGGEGERPSGAPAWFQANRDKGEGGHGRGGDGQPDTKSGGEGGGKPEGKRPLPEDDFDMGPGPLGQPDHFNIPWHRREQDDEHDNNDGVGEGRRSGGAGSKDDSPRPEDLFPAKRPEDAPYVAQFAVGSMHRADDVVASSIGDDDIDGGSTPYDTTAKQGGPVDPEDDPFNELDRYGRSIDSGLTAKTKPFPDWFQPDTEGRGQRGEAVGVKHRGSEEEAEGQSQDDDVEDGEAQGEAQGEAPSAAASAQADADSIRAAMQAEQRFGQDAFASKIYVGGSLQSAAALVETASDDPPAWAGGFVDRLRVPAPSPAAVAAAFAHVWRGRMGQSTEEQRLVAEAAKRAVAGARYGGTKSAGRSAEEIQGLQLDGPRLPGDSAGVVPDQQGVAASARASAVAEERRAEAAATQREGRDEPAIPDVIKPKSMVGKQGSARGSNLKTGAGKSRTRTRKRDSAEELGGGDDGASRPKW